MDCYINGRICGGTIAIYRASQTLRAESPLLRAKRSGEFSLLLRPGSPRWGARPASFYFRDAAIRRARVAIAWAKRCAVTGAVTMNNDGSVSSSSMIIGRRSAPGTMSTRA